MVLKETRVRMVNEPHPKGMLLDPETAVLRCPVDGCGDYVVITAARVDVAAAEDEYGMPVGRGLQVEIDAVCESPLHDSPLTLNIKTDVEGPGIVRVWWSGWEADERELKDYMSRGEW